MRKVNYLWFLAIVAMMSSCLNDDYTASVQNKVVETGFVLSVENGIATRAISDGFGVDKLVYAVFDAEGNVVVEKTEYSNIEEIHNGYEISLPLLYGRTYTIVLWAQDSDCTAYTISEDMKLTVDYSGLNNDETRDAFFAKETFTVNSLTHSEEVTLKRPFAQINVGSYIHDVEVAETLGFDVKYSSASIKGVANVLDLKTGETEGEVDVLYDFSVIPAEHTDPKEYLSIDIDGDGVKDDFEYLSMSYILANERSTYSMAFVFKNEEGYDIEFKSGLDCVPAERNWRTNIVGQILSKEPITPEGTIFSINIDPAYLNHSYSDFEDININNGYIFAYGENTVIQDQKFVFDDMSNFAYFGSGGDLKLENVEFSGRIGAVSFGIYGNATTTTSNYHLKNVSITDLTIDSYFAVNNNGIMSFGAYLYGKANLENCKMKGIKLEGEKNSEGNFINRNELEVYDYFDCAVVNSAEVVFNGGEYGKIYTYEHAKTTITGDVTIDIITTRTIKTSGNGYLKIEGGTINEIKFLPIGSYKPRITIEEGATVSKIDFGGASTAYFVNNSGKEIELVNVGQ